MEIRIGFGRYAIRHYNNSKKENRIIINKICLINTYLSKVNPAQQENITEGGEEGSPILGRLNALR